ncbi:hypothetical protein SISNIDRAFT_281565 [Sistotremastrum niveocremeum HHB9708]|uniref:Uncharacterized protein n=1 Tax=Sistotremastrum niveocremeum HHB9708 TaxID=1314777 RepID=A0A164Y6P7_9AGAM|nr:hypothetical protein SISNIDRAFT_281565 [Sistotremastrum niveocremeum HHB9708]
MIKLYLWFWKLNCSSRRKTRHDSYASRVELCTRKWLTTVVTGVLTVADLVHSTLMTVLLTCNLLFWHPPHRSIGLIFHYAMTLLPGRRSTRDYLILQPDVHSGSPQTAAAPHRATIEPLDIRTTL